MPRSANLKWTPKQKEIAALLNQGMGVTEVVEKGHSRPVVQRVKKALKKQLSTEAPPQPKPMYPPQPPSDSRVRVSTMEPAQVGGIFIEKTDWIIGQYGGFLIMDTFHRAREKFGYEGTVPDFLCDACQVVRRVMGLDIMPFDYLLKEADNGTGEEASQGGAIPGEAGDELNGPEWEE